MFQDISRQEKEEQEAQDAIRQFVQKDVLLPDEKAEALKLLRKEMKVAAERLDFETAIALRDQISKIKKK